MISKIGQREQLPRSIAVRTDGLLGDNIVASTAFEFILNSNPGHQIVVVNTYNHDPGHIVLLSDLFSGLIRKGVIRKILHFPRPHGPLTTCERRELLSAGSSAVYDCGPFEEEFHKLPKGKPFLGVARKELGNDQREILVALFRYSGFHSHYPLRNRPYEEWRKIERMIESCGARPVLFGLDDAMPITPSTIDLRGRISVYDTLAYVLSCRCLISTTTFLPLYAQHFIPCFVLSDPDDIPNLVYKWKVLQNFSILDVTKDYLHVLDRQLGRSLSNSFSTV